MPRAKRSPKGYLTPQEVADLLMVSPITVRQWAQKGWLEAQTTPGGHRRFMWRHVELFARDRGLTLHHGDESEFKVLIVDDDQQFADFLSEAISTLDDSIVVAIANSGFEAGQRVRAFLPHIILLDLMVPGVDGFTVCRQIKSDPVTKSIDIVAVTDFHTPENEEHIINAGARTCLAKPINLSLLARELGIDVGHAAYG